MAVAGHLSNDAGGMAFDRDRLPTKRITAAMIGLAICGALALGAPAASAAGWTELPGSQNSETSTAAWPLRLANGESLWTMGLRHRLPDPRPRAGTHDMCVIGQRGSGRE